ncbi:MAG: GHKL domain-containing protein [Planctomycetaceae bacterium]|nr:GHKL domain-containing protein [Planctomycetaceae bacterium]
MVTNGTALTPKRFEPLCAAGITSIAFSIDSLDPERFARARQGARLEQVLANLIRNAIDAMAALAGERILRISARPGADGCVELAVADQGPGLAEAIRADPFLPFATTKPDGVGLGLPICRTIVENHGGRLWVEHSSPAGTTFCFTLPALAG